MNNFQNPRDGAGFSRTRQGKNPLPAPPSRSGLLPFSSQASRLAQFCPPMKPFLIATHRILETELTHSRQRRNHFLIATFSARFAKAGVAEPQPQSRGDEIHKNPHATWLRDLSRRLRIPDLESLLPVRIREQREARVAFSRPINDAAAHFSWPARLPHFSSSAEISYGKLASES